MTVSRATKYAALEARRVFAMARLEDRKDAGYTRGQHVEQAEVDRLTKAMMRME